MKTRENTFTEINKSEFPTTGLELKKKAVTQLTIIAHFPYPSYLCLFKL